MLPPVKSIAFPVTVMSPRDVRIDCVTILEAVEKRWSVLILMVPPPPWPVAALSGLLTRLTSWAVKEMLPDRPVSFSTKEEATVEICENVRLRLPVENVDITRGACRGNIEIISPKVAGAYKGIVYLKIMCIEGDIAAMTRPIDT